MSKNAARGYDPRTYRGLTFHDATERFRDGRDTPRAYLERCLATIAEHESSVQAFAACNAAAARAAADASSARWKGGRPLSAIDGMAIGIKDLLETMDMPTGMGCEACRENFPKRDNAAVWALREAGAVVVGKTVTAELGGAEPGPTRNPFDTARTPGGSSSGSAAAVAARMLPAAIGTQVGGSIIRPAGFCGNVALKPTQGAINRGERQATSMSTHGVHAAAIEDMWQVAIEIAQRAGGDRGSAGLFGPARPPQARKPERLIVLETAGWAGLDAESKSAFTQLLGEIAAEGVQMVSRAEDPDLERLERAIADAGAVCSAITAWENRWWQRSLIAHNPQGVSDRAKLTLAKAEAMTVTDYRAALSAREVAQLNHRRIAPLADAVITLSCPGPAPLWTNAASNPRPTGDAIFNYPSSLLFAPAVSVPMLAVRGMPVGVQLMGQQHGDAAATAMARWLLENIRPVVVGEG
jgi:Asp-tRNA(Asn)/Glu-tRNA(Gln) amidotransferase A subunit family amidase